MQTQWSDVSVMLDAEVLRLYLWPGWGSEPLGAPDILVRHEGRPAEVMTQVLRSLPCSQSSIQRQVRVCIGSPWTQTMVLPWQAGLLSKKTWSAHARKALSGRARRGNFQACVDDQAFGRARLATGICSTFLGSIRRACIAAGWHLIEACDLLSVSLALNADALDGDDWCFVFAEQKVITCLFHRQGEWRNAVAFPRIDDTVEEWIVVGSLMASQPRPEKIYINDLRVSDGCIDVESIHRPHDWRCWLGKNGVYLLPAREEEMSEQSRGCIGVG